MYRMFVALVLLCMAVTVPRAEALVPSGVDPLSISVFPRYPRPYETVTVTLKSNLVDLLRGDNRISLNGTVLDEGVGIRSASFTMSGSGETTTIEATVTVDEQTFTKQLVLRANDVALIMEPVTTSHPFYHGGVLPAPEGRLRLIALAHFETPGGSLIPPQDLVYEWRLGEQVLQNESGAGRYILTATAPVKYRDARVTVTVTTKDGSLSGETSVLVSPSDPVVRIYRNDPLLGIRFEEALSGSIALSGDEETFRVIPYFFEAPPVLSWTINSVEQSTGEDITLRATGGGVGSANVGISARNRNAFQSATQTLTVTFGETRPSFFGL